MDKEKFLKKLMGLGFKPYIQNAAGMTLLSLRYQTGTVLTGDFKVQVLSALDDLRRLIDIDIEKVKGLEL